MYNPSAVQSFNHSILQQIYVPIIGITKSIQSFNHSIFQVHVTYLNFHNLSIFQSFNRSKSRSKKTCDVLSNHSFNLSVNQSKNYKKFICPSIQSFNLSTVQKSLYTFLIGSFTLSSVQAINH